MLLKDLFPQANILSIVFIYFSWLIVRWIKLVFVSWIALKRQIVLIWKNTDDSNGIGNSYEKNKQNYRLTEYKYYYLFGQRTEAGIVEEMLDYDEESKVNYNMHQQLLSAINNKDYKSPEKIVNTKYHKLLSTYTKTSIKTLRKQLPYIKNSFLFPFNNGRIEGINNKIKMLNRIAYGYRNFKNYKNRILLHFKLKPIVDKKGKTFWRSISWAKYHDN